MQNFSIYDWFRSLPPHLQEEAQIHWDAGPLGVENLDLAQHLMYLLMKLEAREGYYRIGVNMCLDPEESTWPLSMEEFKSHFRKVLPR